MQSIFFRQQQQLVIPLAVSFDSFHAFSPMLSCNSVDFPAWRRASISHGFSAPHFCPVICVLGYKASVFGPAV